MIKILDCTLRDGGYYNDWNFSRELISDYLQAMQALQVDFVEIGFRSLKNKGFKGGCAFSTDSFLNSLSIPQELKDRIGVMINGSELIGYSDGLESALEKLFPAKQDSPVTLVRIACHVHEFEQVLPATAWLKKQGYLVGFNLMQIADRTTQEIEHLAKLANEHAIDVLYFADSMGSLNPQQTESIIHAIKKGWSGEIGIHTHDNMGQALANSKQAVEAGVVWVDGTVTGMGRGPGNVKTEYLAIELSPDRQGLQNLTKLLEVIRKHFKPLHAHYGWGSNSYYYLAGKYGIHPSYIQEMICDSRYNEEDILAVINHLKREGGKKFNLGTLDAARHFYSGKPRGTWQPKEQIEGKEVLILGSGPGVAHHQMAIEHHIINNQPFVIALNTQKNIEESLIDIRAACHPVRLLADCHEHMRLPQPLATPVSMLPKDVQEKLKTKELFDFGLSIQSNTFNFGKTHCTLPSSLVIAYALAIATSGQASRILLAGFDGYAADDPRYHEAEHIFQAYQASHSRVPIFAITPTLYEVPSISVYGPKL